MMLRPAYTTRTFTVTAIGEGRIDDVAVMAKASNPDIHDLITFECAATEMPLIGATVTVRYEWEGIT